VPDIDCSSPNDGTLIVAHGRNAPIANNKPPAVIATGGQVGGAGTRGAGG
jgi:hypothetical protein